MRNALASVLGSASWSASSDENEQVGSHAETSVSFFSFGKYNVKATQIILINPECRM